MCLMGRCPELALQLIANGSNRWEALEQVFNLFFHKGPVTPEEIASQFDDHVHIFAGLDISRQQYLTWCNERKAGAVVEPAA